MASGGAVAAASPTASVQTVVREENVGRLHAPVHAPGFVERLDPSEGAGDGAEAVEPRERLEPLIQRPAGRKRGHHALAAAVERDADRRKDVRMRRQGAEDAPASVSLTSG